MDEESSGGFHELVKLMNNSLNSKFYLNSNSIKEYINFSTRQ